VVLPDARAVALGPGGLLAVATDTAVRVFRGSEERRSWPVPGPTTLDLAWSPDGRWITTAHLEGRAIRWDVGTGRHVATFGLHEDRVAALDFSPSGELLATVSWDRSARLWRLAPVINPPLPAAEEARWGVTLAQALGDGSG
jgi:WD40 repeat protein